MSTAVGGLEHRGLLHDSADDLAEAVLPDVRAALTAGDAVTLMLDRRTTREIRDALGPDGDAVDSAAPTEVFRGGPAGVLARLRSWAGPGRRTLVVGQYSGLVAADADRAVVEDGVDLVLADVPLTVLCTCPRDADTAAIDRLRRHHRDLRDGRDVVANPAHRPAVDRVAVPGVIWGPAVLRAAFRDLADLRDLRGRVVAATATAGLVGELADAAVLAVHEAAVMACGLRGGTAADCTVEIHADGGTMLTDITAPGAEPAGTDPLDLLRLFSRAATVEDADSERHIRVLSGA